jgi:hypothetical protein
MARYFYTYPYIKYKTYKTTVLGGFFGAGQAGPKW